MMTRRWYWRLFFSWFIPAIILYSILSILLTELNWLAVLIVWWCKPLLDRAPLHIASRNLFDERVSRVDMIRSLTGLYKRDALAWLTWRRLSLNRSFDMPVTMLEALRGTERQRRINVLHLASGSAASWLTIICVHLEWVIVIGLIALISILTPDEFVFSFMSALIEQDQTASLVYNSLTVIAMSLVAPFYTVAGFSLYINRRIRLEAWDLEVRFRYMAERHERSRAASAVLQIMLITICLMSLITPHRSLASDNGSDSTYLQQQSKEIITEILAGSDFHNEEIEKGWRFKQLEEEEAEEYPQWLIDFIRWLEGMMPDDDSTEEDSALDLALLFEILLWAIAAAATLYVISLAYQHRHRFRLPDLDRDQPSAPLPEVLFGLDVKESAIPDDLSERVQALWREQRYRESAALLYASTLSLLMHRFGFRFTESDTETECAAVVDKQGPISLSQYMRSVTRIWQQIAYAHLIPDGDPMRDLCERWDMMYRDE